MAEVEVKGKIPIDFVRKYLATKGHKTLHGVMCFDCPFDTDEVFPEHPIKWLWNHVQMGHNPSFDCCHCWNQKIGGGDYAEIQEWYRWFTFTWSKERNDWIVTDTYQGCEGFEEPSPAYCWKR